MVAFGGVTCYEDLRRTEASGFTCLRSDSRRQHCCSNIDMFTLFTCMLKLGCLKKEEKRREGEKKHGETHGLLQTYSQPSSVSVLCLIVHQMDHLSPPTLSSSSSTVTSINHFLSLVSTSETHFVQHCPLSTYVQTMDGSSKYLRSTRSDTYAQMFKLTLT